MDAALDELVAADEDLRARVAGAGREARARIDGAAAARAERNRARGEDASARLAAELGSLASAADAEVEERARRRAEWVARTRTKGQETIAQAARLFAGIVRDGAPE